MARVRPADGPRSREIHGHLPGDEVWLIAEFRPDETKYYLSNLPASASFKTAVSSIKARWSCEQMQAARWAPRRARTPPNDLSIARSSRANEAAIVNQGYANPASRMRHSHLSDSELAATPARATR